MSANKLFVGAQRMTANKYFFGEQTMSANKDFSANKEFVGTQRNCQRKRVVTYYRGTSLIRNRHPPQDPHRALGMVLL